MTEILAHALNSSGVLHFFSPNRASAVSRVTMKIVAGNSRKKRLRKNLVGSELLRHAGMLPCTGVSCTMG